MAPAGEALEAAQPLVPSALDADMALVDEWKVVLRKSTEKATVASSSQAKVQWHGFLLAVQREPEVFKASWQQ